MIMVGNQRGGGRDLARHLLKEENERVVVHEIRGFASDNLQAALHESYAVSQGTRCKQHLYSLSLNPPKEAVVSPDAFEDAVNRAEKRLGLEGQPRAIVFHEKRGLDGEVRRHAHAVWCRIDVEAMKAVQLSFDHTKLQSLGRELYIEHGWKMPRGFVNAKETNPRNYSLAEWQQAKRAKKDPLKLKGMFQDCWAISDSQTSFANSIKENGYILARGDRRGVVAVDHSGEVFSVRQYVGIKPKQVRERVADEDALPDVATAHRLAAMLITDRLKELQAEQNRIAMENLRRLAAVRRQKQKAQREYARAVLAQQQSRTEAEEAARQARVKVGWRGLLDRVTGKRKTIEAENLRAAIQSERRDSAERTALNVVQRAAREETLRHARMEKTTRKAIIKDLADDVDRIDTRTTNPTPESERSSYVRKERKNAERPKRRSRRPRDGPSPGR